VQVTANAQRVRRRAGVCDKVQKTPHPTRGVGGSLGSQSLERAEKERAVGAESPRGPMIKLGRGGGEKQIVVGVELGVDLSKIFRADRLLLRGGFAHKCLTK
jgi:hypothetical protein